MNLIHPRDPRSADAADIVYCVLCIIDKQFIYLLLTHHFLNGTKKLPKKCPAL